MPTIPSYLILEYVRYDDRLVDPPACSITPIIIIQNTPDSRVWWAPVMSALRKIGFQSATRSAPGIGMRGVINFNQLER